MHPLATLSLAFLSGAGAGLLVRPDFRFAAWGITVVLGFVLFGGRKRHSSRMRWSLLFFLVSALGLCRTLEAQRAFDSCRALFPSGARGLFTLRVDSEPDLTFEWTPAEHETGRSGGFYLPQISKVRADATLLSFEGRELPPIRVRINLRQKPEHIEAILSYGDVVRVKGILSSPNPAMNPGGFDYAGYLKAKTIPFTLSARSGDWNRTGIRVGNFFIRESLDFRRLLEEKATALWTYPDNAFWVGLILGGDQTLSDDLVQKFTVTGTVHILAVSGENTAMVTGLLFLMLRVCGFGRKGASWAALVGLFFFVFMTGVQPSVCRAGLWGAFILMALILERRPRLGTLVLFSAAILTALNPFVLSDLSFQLSYLAAIGLVVWMPWWVEKTKRLGRFLSMTLSATLGAQMGVWVLMTAMFNQFATYSIPANLAVAPLVGAATAAGLLALLSAWVWAAAGRLFAAAADVPLRLLLWTASWIAGWPGASLVVATPPDTWLVLFHLLLGLTLWVAWPVETPERPSLTWEGVESRRTRARVVLKSLWGLFLVGTLVAWGFASSRPKPFRMTFLSVGHGDAVVAEDPQGRVMVLDGGPKRDGPARWNPVVAYLHHQGHRKVDIVLNSHPDADHVGGLSAVVESFPVGVAYQPLGAQSQSRAYQGFVDALNKRGVPLEPLSRGDRLTLGPEENLEVIHPPQGFHPRKKKDNNRSLGIWVTFPKGEDARTFLLPGDMEKEAWDVWLGTARRPERVDVFLAAHHGRASGQPERVMRALLPREVVVSDSDPHPEIRPLARDGRREVILETAREGAISVEVDASGKMEVSRFKPSKDKEPDEVAISQEEIGTLEP